MKCAQHFCRQIAKSLCSSIYTNESPNGFGTPKQRLRPLSLLEEAAFITFLRFFCKRQCTIICSAAPPRRPFSWRLPLNVQSRAWPNARRRQYPVLPYAYSLVTSSNHQVAVSWSAVISLQHATTAVLSCALPSMFDDFQSLVLISKLGSAIKQPCLALVVKP